MGAGAGKRRYASKSEVVLVGDERSEKSNGSFRSQQRQDSRQDDGLSSGNTSPAGDMFESRSESRANSKKKRGNKSVHTKFMSLWKPEKELREFKPHVEFLRAIASPTTGLSNYCHTIISEVVKVLEADRCSIYFVDEIRKEVWCIGASDCEPFRLPWERGIVGLVARDGKTLNITDPHSHDAFEKVVEQKTGYTVHNMLTVPIRHMVDQARSVGVIQCLNKQAEGPFTTQDEQELEKFAMIISDSFYRQRWRALESSAKLEQEASALLATMSEVQGKLKPVVPAVDGVPANSAPTSPFVWPEDAAVSALQAAATAATASTEAEDTTAEAPLSSETPGEGEGAGAGGEGQQEIALESETIDFVGMSSAPSSSPSALRRLTFNTLAYSSEDLVRLVPAVFEDTGVLTSGCVVPDRLRTWVWAVERTYRSNPFHNWYHAFSVFQSCYAQLWHCKFSGLRFLDVFAVLIAGLCHDLDHPGLTNSFLVDGEDELALRYNDNSVLENHHAHLACELLRKDETAIGACLARADQITLRRTIIKSILDTDMMRHNELCQSTLARVAASGSVAAEAESEVATPADRQWILSMVLHSSDLSAQLQRWPVAAAWEERISQEFVNQARLELSAGRQPAPFMQFAMDDVSQRGKLQRNFIDYVLVPMWDPYTQLQPALRPCFSRLLANRENYDYRSTHGCDPPAEITGAEPDKDEARAMIWPCC